jgi:hypothetical protein
MKGLIRYAAILMGCAVGAVGAGCGTLPTTCDANGCGHSGCGPTAQELTGCSNCLYDPCYPQRYNNLSTRAVNRAFTPQVINGHVLDQTVWNHHFDPGTDRLTPGGMAVLQYLSRRRPEPDTTIYLATALDLPYDPACPERYCGAKQELDQLRAAAIQKYLAGLNCGRPTDFRVCVHDPADPTISTIPAASAVLQMYARYRGGLATGAGGAGGAAGPSGSGTAVGGGR